MRESEFQHKLINKIKSRFPGCIVLKNDATYIQGIPDLSVFYEDKYAFLEVKRSSTAPHRPNQKYWIDKIDGMSYAKTIYPENEEEILNGLAQTFGLSR